MVCLNVLSAIGKLGQVTGIRNVGKVCNIYGGQIGLIEEVRSEQQLEECWGVTHVEMWRKRILGRRSSLCKSHKVEVCLNYKRNSKKAKLCENSRRWNQTGEREIDHIGSLKNILFYSEWNAKPLEGFEQGATWSLMFWKDYFGDFVENRI